MEPLIFTSASWFIIFAVSIIVTEVYIYYLLGVGVWKDDDGDV